jgi:hypothetical protein
MEMSPDVGLLRSVFFNSSVFRTKLSLLFSVQLYETAVFAVEDVDSLSDILVSLLQGDFGV